MDVIKKVSDSILNFKKNNNLPKNSNMKTQNIQSTNIRPINYSINQSKQTSSETINNEYEIMGNKVNLPYKDWIFGPEAIKSRQFGGYQGSLVKNSAKYINDPKIKEIVSKYYQDVDAEDLELLFYRMKSVGCGYISVINSILFEYGYFQDKHSAADFSNRFGFPIESLENGYNFDYLFLDFFLYYAKEFKGFKTIEEVYGNVKEEREQTGGGDSALNHDEFKRTGMKGANLVEGGEVLRKYLESKGINIKVYDMHENLIPVKEEDKERLKEKLIEEYKSQGLDISLIDYNLIKYSVEEVIKMSLSDINLVMNVRGDDFPLYYPEDIDGNGKLDDVYYGDVGAHAMTVVGLTDDPTKVVVSSWGKEFVMDIADINDYVVIDYADFNGVKSSL